MPTGVHASAVSTRAVEVIWTSSTDAVSGLSHYVIYRDGWPVGTTSDTTFVDAGLTPGDTYVFEVSAVDVAGNESVVSTSVNETVPIAALWISVTPASVSMGGTEPGLRPR